MNLPTESIDELGRKLHVGTTTDIPDVTVTFEAFDVSHNIFSYLTGYTPGTFPVSGASITELKNVDVIGQIRDTTTLNIVNALYVKRGIITGIDASFGVRDNSTVSYTVSSNSKKEFKQPVFYQQFTINATASGSISALTNTPSFLTRTSGYTIDAYRMGSDGSTNYLDENLNGQTQKDYVVNGTQIQWLYTGGTSADTIWVTYCAASPSKTFEALDDVAPAAIQGKYVPLTISVSSIPRVQSATIRVAFESEGIFEMGGLGKPVGYEVGIPQVTGDISVLKTDNDLLNLIQNQASTTVESDMEYAATTLPLKIQLKKPSNPNATQLTYYVPSVTFTAEGDDSTVNQSMNETFSWQSTTGELYVASGAGPW
jgi:hypothetical protein